MAGPDLADALRECRRLACHRSACTVAFWNGPGASSERVAAECLDLPRHFAGERLDWRLSLKAPALGYAREAASEIAERSREAGADVHFDSLGPDAVERTFALVEGIADPSRMGVTIPGRWRRSLQDADRAIAGGLAVRVVKGEWADPRGERDLRAGFLDVVDVLAGRARRVSVATHDVPLAREAIRRLTVAGTPHEVEVLFGHPSDPVCAVARSLGVAVRTYVPYGRGCLPYRFVEARDPRAVARIVRDLLLVTVRGVRPR